MENKKKKIIFATGIYPPNVGGPAVYVKNLGKKIVEYNYDIHIVTYGKADGEYQDRRGTKISVIGRNRSLLKRYSQYFKKVKSLAKDANLVYAFDISSSGLPAWLASKVTGKKFMVRVGGDFLWEKAAENEWTNLPLSLYYKKIKGAKQKLLFILIKFYLKRIGVIIFTVDWLKDIYQKYYGIKENRAVSIANPFPSIEFRRTEMPRDKTIVFAGRIIKLKNLKRVIEAIKGIDEVKLNIYGEGPEEENLKKIIKDLKLENRVAIFPKIEHYKLLNMFKDAFLVLVPALSEVSPNTVLECIKLKQPVLVTNACGYYLRFKDYLISIDPMSVDDIRRKIKLLLNEENYKKYVTKIKEIDDSRGWGAVARDHDELFKKLLT